MYACLAHKDLVLHMEYPLFKAEVLRHKVQNTKDAARDPRNKTSNVLVKANERS